MHDPQAKQKIAQKNQDPDADAVKTEKVAQSESILQAQFCNPAHSIDRVALAHPQRTNLIYGEQNWTVRESAKITRQIAELLLHLGVAAGERVALIARNTPYHLWIHAACARIGAIFVPISYRLQARELAQLLTICTPRVAVFDVETVSATYSDAITQLPKINSVFYLDADPQAPQCDTNLLERHKIHAFTAAYRDLPGKLLSVVKRKIAQIPAAKSQADPLLLSQIEYPTGLAAILFTSGSVGIPKAVGLTHAQLYWGNQNFRDGFEYSTVDRELVVAPLTHIGGFNGTTLDLFAHGGTVVVMREFDPEQLLTLLERHRVAMMFGVPTIYAAMLNHPKFAQFDLSNFRLPLIGGAVAAKSLLQRMIDAGLRPINVWGMTETAASGCCLSSAQALTAIGSIGVPFPRIATRIIDPETGTDSENGVGELVLSGPSVVQEYWNDPQATKAAFDGVWLHTGDLVQMDENGNFWVTGRIHNLINTGGEKVAPEEVERVLSEFPGVRDCTVVGIPDERWGEAIAAALILEKETPVPDLPALHSFAKGRIASYKLPKFIVPVPEFPIGANGKVDRLALAKLLSAASLQAQL